MTTERVDEIRFEVRDNVAWVTIDRQRVLNAIDEKAALRCNQIWNEIESDASIRAVVITGAGSRAFCTGADMSAEGLGKNGLEYWANLEPDGFAGLSLRRSLDIPVIARVNGYAFGGEWRSCWAPTSWLLQIRRSSGSPNPALEGSRSTAESSNSHGESHMRRRCQSC